MSCRAWETTMKIIQIQTNSCNKKRTRGMKRKAQTSCSASAPPPGVTEQSKTSKTQPEGIQQFNVDELKNQLGIDKILQSISSLTCSVKQLGSYSTTIVHNSCNENGMQSTESTVRTSDNNSPDKFTQTILNRPLRNKQTYLNMTHDKLLMKPLITFTIQLINFLPLLKVMILKKVSRGF